MAERIPVTVLTGYLGAGKTTLLNRILSEPQGQKFAVIVNEFGEIGIDNDLVVGADEEVFEMNNGCICCTVRGDLIRIVGGLMKRRGKFDGIIIETTGLANPAPGNPPTKAPRTRPISRFLVDAIPECRFTVRGQDLVSGSWLSSGGKRCSPGPPGWPARRAPRAQRPRTRPCRRRR